MIYNTYGNSKNGSKERQCFITIDMRCLYHQSLPIVDGHGDKGVGFMPTCDRWMVYHMYGSNNSMLNFLIMYSIYYI